MFYICSLHRNLTGRAHIMRMNKPAAVLTAATVAVHYGVALYLEAKSGLADTAVPQPPVAALSLAASSTSAITVINTYPNAISDAEYVGAAHERWPFVTSRST
jgi:hypothetical protein